jgi:hypothetical protein
MSSPEAPADGPRRAGRATDGREPSRDANTLRLITITVDSLDPVRGVEAVSARIQQQLFDCLYTYPDGSFDVEPRLVADASVSVDRREYWFELKRGVRFHDGSELTAADVVYSWERLAASEHSQLSAFVLDVLGVDHEIDDGDYVPWSLAVETADRYAVRMTLREPFHATFEVLALPCFAPVPEGVVGDVAGYDGRLSDEAFAERPVGTGPFRLERWERGDRLAACAFDAYHGEGPGLDGIEWRVFSDDDEKYAAARDGWADLFGIPVSAYDPGKVSVDRVDESGRERGTYGPVAGGETFNYVGVPVLNTFYLGFNAAAVDLLGGGRGLLWRDDRGAVDAVAGREHLVEHPVVVRGGERGGEVVVVDGGEREVPRRVDNGVVDVEQVDGLADVRAGRHHLGLGLPEHGRVKVARLRVERREVGGVRGQRFVAAHPPEDAGEGVVDVREELALALGEVEVDVHDRLQVGCSRGRLGHAGITTTVPCTGRRI